MLERNVLCHFIENTDVGDLGNIGVYPGEPNNSKTPTVPFSNVRITMAITNLFLWTLKFSPLFTISSCIVLMQRPMFGGIISPKHPTSPSLSTSKSSSTSTTPSAEIRGGCHGNIARFVSRENLCDSLDSKSNSFGNTSNTCAGLCGHPKTYNSLACACDEKCVLYKDCCWDMQSECPDTYIRGKATYNQLAQVAFSCKDSTLIIGGTKVTKKQPNLQANPREEMDSPNSDNTSASLEKLFYTVDSFLVADKTLGIIFDSYKSPSYWGVANDRLAFVPRGMGLYCMNYDVFHTIDSFLKAVRYCRSRITKRDVRTVFDRNCARENTISCACGESHIVQQTLHDACEGNNNSISLLEENLSMRVSEENPHLCTHPHVHPLLKYLQVPTILYRLFNFGTVL